MNSKPGSPHVNQFLTLLATAAVMAASSAETSPQAAYRDGQRYSRMSTEAYQELLRQAPDSPYILALNAEQEFKDRQYGTALASYKQALRRLPELRGMHLAIAEIDKALGKPADAAAEIAAERKEPPPDCTVHKSECEFLAGKFREVVESATSKHDPEDLYWLTRGAKELAIQSFAALEKFPDSPQFREFRGEMLFLSENYKGVLPELKRLQKAEPNSAKLNFFVGDSLFETEQLEEAVPYLETALKLDAKLRPADVALGLCYVRLGEAQKAIPYLEKGLVLDRDGTLYYQLARAYQEVGQPDRAKLMLDKYQEIHKQASDQVQ